MPDVRNSSSAVSYARTSSQERCDKTSSEQLRIPRSCYSSEELVVVGGKLSPREHPLPHPLRAPVMRSPISAPKAAATKQPTVGAVDSILRPRGGGDDGNRRAQARGVAPAVWPDQPDRRQSKHRPKQHLVS